MQLMDTTNIKAILPVHLFGYPANMGVINEFSSEDQIVVIEDAACGFGSNRWKACWKFWHDRCF